MSPATHEFPATHEARSVLRKDRLHRRHFFLLVILALMVAPACVSQDQYLRARNTIERQDQVISNYESEFGSLRSRVDRLDAELKRKAAELDRALSSEDALQEAHEALMAKYREFESMASRDLPAGVSVESRADGVAFQVEGAVLFDSGKTEIRDGGKATLLDLIARMRGGEEQIRIEGHTDNEPVTNTRHLYPLGNLQLSGQRALQVADFMIRNGIDEDRLHYAGFGEHRPRSDNSTEAGRAQNRRVEIVVLFEPRQ